MNRRCAFFQKKKNQKKSSQFKLLFLFVCQPGFLKMYQACFEGNMEAVLDHIRNKKCDWNEGLRGACQGACQGGNKKIVEWISQGEPFLDWNWGLKGACQGGHKEIAELMISKGASNWNWGLYSACQGGHQETAELMISKGEPRGLVWDWGLYGACQGGHKNMVEWMISKGGNKDMVEYMISKDANSLALCSLLKKWIYSGS